MVMLFRRQLMAVQLHSAMLINVYASWNYNYMSLQYRSWSCGGFSVSHGILLWLLNLTS